MEYFKFIQAYKRRTNVLTRCRILELCQRYKIDIGICDFGKKSLPRSVKEKNIRSYSHKNHYCVNWKKNRKHNILNGEKEKEGKFKFVKKRVNKYNLSQKNRRHRFPKHETGDQLENVFVFDSET